MPTTSKEVIKKLLKDGWKLKTIKGSHHKYEKNGQIVIVPHHNKEIKKGLLKNLEKQTSLELDNK